MLLNSKHNRQGSFPKKKTPINLLEDGHYAESQVLKIFYYDH